MKILMVAVFWLSQEITGYPGKIEAIEMAYAPSFENCRTFGYKYVREEVGKTKGLELDHMMCIELTDEEGETPEATVEAGRKFIGLGRARP